MNNKMKSKSKTRLPNLSSNREINEETECISLS